MRQRLHNKKEFKKRRVELRNNSTTAEQTLWKHIRGSRLGHKFRRQHGIGKYIVDFYCPEKRLIIELDGSIHGEERQQCKDIKRQHFLEKNGSKVLRYRNEQIRHDLDAVLQDIQNHCQRINHP